MKITFTTDDGETTLFQVHVETKTRADMQRKIDAILCDGIHDEFGECDCCGLYRPWREMVPRDTHDELGQYVCPEHLTAK